MNRRNALWFALLVAAAGAAAFLIARRASAQPAVAPVAPWAPDPGPASVVAAPEVAAEAPEDVEKPLPTWVRVTIVAAALVAFFAVSLIATRSV